MELAQELRSFAQDFITSYDARISAVETIWEAAYDMLDDLKHEIEKRIAQIRETLAKSQSLRKRDFDAMMKEILSQQDEREKKVKDMLKDYLKEQKEMANVLKEGLAKSESIKIDDFRGIIKEIQARQEEKEVEVRKTLADFRREQEEMSQELKKLLANGESLRIKDFKAMIKAIQAREKERRKEVAQIKREANNMLADFHRERNEMVSNWQKLVFTMEKRRKEKLSGAKGG